jgi:hypothetical protein
MRRTNLPSAARSRLTRAEQARRRRQHAMRLNISIRYQGRLKILVDIGPVWIGIIITMLATSFWPQLHPVLQFLPSLTGVSLPILDMLRRG